MKKIHTSIITLIIFFLSLNTSAIELKYNNTLIGMINNQVILESNVNKQSTLLSLLIFFKKELTDKELKVIALEDIINTKIQVNIAKDYDVELSEDDMKDVYTQLIMREKSSLREYINVLKRNDITTNDFQSFLKDSLVIEKLHERLLYEQIKISSEDFDNLEKFSNNTSLKYLNNNYEILHIAIKNNKPQLKKIKNILKLLTKKNHNEIIGLTFNKKLLAKNKIFNIHPILDLEKKIHTHMIKNINSDVVGPIYSNNTINFIKLIKKKNIFKKLDSDIKIKHLLIKRKYKKTEESVKHKIRNLKNLNKIKNFSLKKLNKENFKTEWLNKKNVSNDFFQKIKHLKKNELSDVFETKIGFHLVKIIDKKYNQNTDIYKEITLQLKTEKLTKLRKYWEKHIKQENLINILNDLH